PARPATAAKTPPTRKPETARPVEPADGLEPEEEGEPLAGEGEPLGAAPGVEGPETEGPEIEELEPEPEELEPEPAVARPSFRDRLAKARNAIAGSFRSILARTSIDADTWDELEEALIRADVGVDTSMELLDELRVTAKEQAITEPAQLLEALKAQLKGRLAAADRSLRIDPGATNVWLFVGVNGVGKTTTIGKVGYAQAQEGRSVLMAAGDTFRAAAAEQLETWAERAKAEFVRGAEGGDPSSVVFDGVQRAHARNIELVLADTAGRLHTKSNLMDELAKVRRVAGKEPGNVTEVLLVLDAVTGQNGLVQAQQFTEATELTGVVLTKLDGSAKGGIVLAIEAKLGIPVKLVGLGEGIGDLVSFDPDEFVDALFER
ncbi:MAG: signal recognition particle-docking protein FtsY, partial [Acidimicrobiia bacterium]|nr:signal recognition particle-docking protein FtsY [Acidimicrobiia bacterium]